MQQKTDKPEETILRSPQYKSSRRKDFPQIEQAFAKHRYMKKKRTASGNINEPIAQTKLKTQQKDSDEAPSRMVRFQSRSFFERYDPKVSTDKFKPSLPSNRELISWIKLELQLVVQEFKLPKYLTAGIQNIFTLKPLFDFIREYVRNIVQLSTTKPSVVHQQPETMLDRKSQIWSRLKIEELQAQCNELTNKLIRDEKEIENCQKEIKNLCFQNESKMNEITILRSQLSMMVTEKPEQIKTINISEITVLRDEVNRLKEELIGKNDVILHLSNIAKQKDEQFDRLRSDKLRLVQMYSSLERQKMENTHIYQQELLKTIKKLCADRRQPDPSFIHETIYRDPPDSRRDILQYIYHSLQTLQNRQDQYRRERKEIAKSREKLLRQTVRGFETARKQQSFSGYHQGNSISHFVGSFTPNLKVVQNDFR